MKEFLERIKESKKLKIAVLSLLCAVAVLIYFLPVESSNRENVSISNNTEQKISNEEKLEAVLSNIKGAGNVRVMITYESLGEVICANTTETQTNTVTEKSENGSVKESETVVENKAPVTIGSGNGENPLVILEKEPEIKGVIVVAQGADNINVRINLQKAVETVLQVSPNQVEIFTMN
ncbi:MAG: hypothetical protein IKB86_08055 [Clostridia bacterium]|nr:hypothetical protein [Clostridia bacterium]